MKKTKYICYHTCVYGPQGRRKLYHSGDVLLPGLKPGKYFSIDGEPPDGVPVENRVTAGDDARSTKQMKEDLLVSYGIDMSDKTRKEVFNRWIEEGGNTKPEPVDSADPPPPDPVLGKKFSEMLPEEIESITAGQIVNKINLDFGKALSPTSTRRGKTNLLKMAIQLETQG